MDCSKPLTGFAGFAGFALQWPGPLILCWGAEAVRVAQTLPQHRPLRNIALAAAIPQAWRPHLLLVESSLSAPRAGRQVCQLYGGATPVLLVDATHSALSCVDWSARNASSAQSVHLPLDSSLRAWAKSICDAAPAPLPLFGDDPEDDVEFEWNVCNGAQCVRDANPEIRCDGCGVAFCSEQCEYRESHICSRRE